MRVVTTHLPEHFIKALDKLVEAKIYPNRAEAIRIAVRDLIMRELPTIEELTNGGGGE